jgi:putative PIG3 family NAD(P)H quinone oxidoreductase
MKFLEVSAEGEGYRASVEEAPDPVPAPDELLVRVAASGINRADLSQILGRYPPPPGESPILGLEASGAVVESGEEVCVLVAGGGHADLVAVPRGQIFPVPRGIDLLSAAAIPEAYLTAFLNLSIVGRLERGGRALIHAGASGVGLAAIRTARYLGASVAATTRSASKLAAMRQAGAELVIDSSTESFAEAIEKAWGGKTIDVVLDPVGADTLAGDLRVLAPEGRVIFLANLSGVEARLDIPALMGKRGHLIGSTLRSRSREEKGRLIARFRREILPGFDSGALSVDVDSVIPAARAGEALARVRENRNTGKVLLDWTALSR